MRSAMLLAAVLVAGLVELATAHYHEKGWGEPYELAGKRMVFTTWYWVRPGQYDWVNDQGASVFTKKDVKAGPNDPHVHWKRIDMPRGVRLIAEPAVKGQFTIKPEHPWEAEGVAIESLFQHGGKIMAWGTCKPGAPPGSGIGCYFESTDGGQTWLRPTLGLREFNGSRENNLYDGQIPRISFYDAAAPPEERFKMLSNDEWDAAEFEARHKASGRPYQRMAVEIVPGKAQAIFAFTSPDGVRWSRVGDPVAIETSDGGQYIVYEPKLKKYVMYLRSGMIGPRADGFEPPMSLWHKSSYRRAIGRAESADFCAFPLSETVFETHNDMAPDDTFYFCCYTTIPGAPDHHLMFPSRYIQAKDSTAIDLHASHDGKTWNRAGTALIETGVYGQWDGGAVWVTNPGLVEMANGDWAIPFRGDVLPHKYPRGEFKGAWGAAIWPKGRLMAIEAPEAGEFTTMAFVAPGAALRINALTSRTGLVRIEAADLDGKPIAGRTFDDSIPIIGDHHRTVVRWKDAEDIGVKAGEPVVLRFRMEQAKIYGLDFE